MVSEFSLANTVLLLIDVQSGLSHPTYWGRKRSNPDFERNFTRLLSTFREANASLEQEKRGSIIHVQHASTSDSSPLHPSRPGFAFFDYSHPKPELGEVVVIKKVNSAFIGTDLEARLKALSAKTIIVAGLTADHCVSTSVRMAADLGVADQGKGRIVLVSDATATWERGPFDAETVHGVQLESLRGEFCDVLDTEEVVHMLVA